jgi:hypothetical protein
MNRYGSTMYRQVVIGLCVSFNISDVERTIATGYSCSGGRGLSSSHHFLS